MPPQDSNNLHLISRLQNASNAFLAPLSSPVSSRPPVAASAHSTSKFAVTMASAGKALGRAASSTSNDNFCPVIKTSKTWVLPPRPKPGRKRSPNSTHSSEARKKKGAKNAANGNSNSNSSATAAKGAGQQKGAASAPLKHGKQHHQPARPVVATQQLPGKPVAATAASAPAIDSFSALASPELLLETELRKATQENSLLKSELSKLVNDLKSLRQQVTSKLDDTGSAADATANSLLSARTNSQSVLMATSASTSSAATATGSNESSASTPPSSTGSSSPTPFKSAIPFSNSSVVSPVNIISSAGNSLDAERKISSNGNNNSGSNNSQGSATAGNGIGTHGNGNFVNFPLLSLGDSPLSSGFHDSDHEFEAISRKRTHEILEFDNDDDDEGPHGYGMDHHHHHWKLSKTLSHDHLRTFDETIEEEDESNNRASSIADPPTAVTRNVSSNFFDDFIIKGSFINDVVEEEEQEDIDEKMVLGQDQTNTNTTTEAPNKFNDAATIMSSSTVPSLISSNSSIVSSTNDINSLMLNLDSSKSSSLSSLAFDSAGLMLSKHSTLNSDFEDVVIVDHNDQNDGLGSGGSLSEAYFNKVIDLPLTLESSFIDAKNDNGFGDNDEIVNDASGDFADFTFFKSMEKEGNDLTF